MLGYLNVLFYSHFCRNSLVLFNVVASGEKFKSTEFVKNKNVLPFVKFETLNLGLNEVRFMMIYYFQAAAGLQSARIFL